jgi:hypothetical protein
MTRKSAFRDKVARDSAKPKNSGNFGHLKLPEGVELFNPEPDTTVKMDVIPYEVTNSKHLDRDADEEIAVEGSLWYKMPYRVHRNVGAYNETVVCLATFGKKCPICEEGAKRKREGADKKELQSYWNSLRNLYVVIPRGVKKVEETLHIMDISEFAFQKGLDKEIKETPAYGIFPDIEEGKTLKVRFDEELFDKNAWAKAGRFDFVDREEVIKESILKKVPHLDDCLKVLSYEELQNKFLEMEDDSAPEENQKSKKKDAEEDEPEQTERKSKKLERSEKVEKQEEKPVNKKSKLSWEDLEEMSTRKLTKLCENEDLKTNPDKFDDEDELRVAVAEELDIDIPKKSSKKEEEKSSPKEESKSKCPSGFKFGVDIDQHKECNSCAKWDACDDMHEALKASK